MVLLGEEAQVEARFDLSDMVLMCTVCVKHTIGSEFILDAPDGTPK